jgi:hypothetical protein
MTWVAILGHLEGRPLPWLTRGNRCRECSELASLLLMRRDAPTIASEPLGVSPSAPGSEVQMIKTPWWVGMVAAHRWRAVSRVPRSRR